MKTSIKILIRATAVTIAVVIFCGSVAAQGDYQSLPPAPQILAQAQQSSARWWEFWKWFRRKPRQEPPTTTQPPPTTTQPPATTEPITTGRLIDKAFFGMHIHNADTTTAWPEATFGVFRLWDTGTDWASLEPTKGNWNFTRLDKDVSLGQAHGAEIILTLGQTPAWASARPTESSPYGPGKAAEPANIADWQNYVKTVAERYRGRIKYYEIWNEPYFDPTAPGGFFTGTPAKLVELASVAYSTIKAADPAAQVISPPTAPPVSYIEPFLAAGGGQYFDIFAAHYYVNPPEGHTANTNLSLLEQHNNLRDLLAKYGLSNKPMWDTEWGYCNVPDGNWYCYDVHTAAAYMARHFLLEASSNIERSVFYAWDDGKMGLIDTKTGALNAEGTAYGTITKWLTGSRLQSCIARSSELWQCEITREARRAWIVWAANPTVVGASALPATIQDAVGLDGQPIAVTAGEPINVGPSPILIKADTDPW